MQEFRMEPAKTVTSFKRGCSMSPEETRVLCAYIKRLCQRLKVKSNVMCSALVFFHRFHSRHIPGAGGVQFDDHDLATACVFLACKVEDSITKLERILEAAHSLQTGRTGLDDQRQMWLTRERTLICERILLDTIAYNFEMDHSHLHASRFALDLSDGDRNEAKQLHQIASNILNDSLSTNLCLRHSAALIGAAAVRLAGRIVKDRNSVSSPAIERLERMEEEGKVFEFETKELLRVEDELISTYEFGSGESEFVKRMKALVSEGRMDEGID